MTGARCSSCKRPVTMETIGEHKDCGGPRRPAAVLGGPRPTAGASHFSAKAGTCSRGHSHPSKVERRVCESVFVWADVERREGRLVVVFLRPRIPCFKMLPDPKGLPHYVSPDFVVADAGGRIARIVDAKSGRKRSPEWRRGRAMLETETGIRVEELDA